MMFAWSQYECAEVKAWVYNYSTVSFDKRSVFFPSSLDSIRNIFHLPSSSTLIIYDSNEFLCIFDDNTNEKYESK